MGTRNRACSGVQHSIRQVWASNFDYEISKLDECLQFHSILSVDTEFPGFIRRSPWGSIEEVIYEDFRFNVNQTKLIQLGITAMNDSGEIGGTWEFNFSDFDPETDDQDSSSISFLEQNGLDFDELKNNGIPIVSFASTFWPIIRKYDIYRWITFHGLYDIGYLIKAMGFAVLPESMEWFADIVVNGLGIVRDLKNMAQLIGLEEGKLGLERLGTLLDQKRYGMKHNAGSDSLLTASTYFELMERFDMELDPRQCDGFLYGFSMKLESMEIDQSKFIRIGEMLYSTSLFSYASNCYIAY